jgi:hypothetical protein
MPKAFKAFFDFQLFTSRFSLSGSMVANSASMVQMSLSIPIFFRLDIETAL